MKPNRFLSVIIAALSFTAAFAQQTSSPYSKFGYGLLRDNATSAQRQMGGVGYAMTSGRQINVMNPASYSRIDSLTFLFDMGVDASFIKSTENGASLNQKGGGLDYITMQFPLSKRIGASFGLLPYSSVGYAFGSEIKNGTNSHQGSGGINQLYVGLSGNIIKGLSAGFNFSYLFGNNINDIYAYTSTGSTSLFEQVIDVRDWHLDIGVQYTLPLNRDNTLGFGFVYSPGKDLLGHANVIKYDVSSNEKPDTVQSMRLRGNFGLPDTWGAGVNFRHGNRWMVEADVTYQQWSKVKFARMADFPATTFADRWKVALGGEWRPKDRGNYFSLVTYRLGGFYNRDYMMIGSNHVREYGLSCGFGFPTMSTKTIINVGFEYKHRQATPSPLLQERYFSVTLGVNFNELWFFKRKIE